MTNGGQPGDRAPGPLEALMHAIAGAADRVADVVRPETVVSVAGTFGFPLALALLVLLFLLIQPRLDDRDPRLRTAPRSPSDLLVEFEEDLA